MLISSSEDEPPRNQDDSVIVVRDPSICKHLWRDFVKSEDFLDSWDFRKLFSDSIGTTPYFITLLKNNKFWGAIPLEYLRSKGKYYAFGGGIWNEYNFLYIGEPITAEDWKVLIRKIPLNSDIKFLRENDSIRPLGVIAQQVTYYLDIPSRAANINFYLERLSGSSRRKLQQKMRNVEKLGVKVQKVDYDISAYIEHYSVKHFGEESTFRSINLRKVLENLNKQTNKFDVQNFLFTLHGEVVAAALGVIHNKVFYAMAVGYSSEVKDLGKYINYFEIDFAREAGIRRINFFADDCGWKEMWKLEKDMLFRYKPCDNVVLHKELTSYTGLLTK